MLVQCWSTVYAAGPTLDQHCFDVSCLLGCQLTKQSLGHRLCHIMNTNKRTTIQCPGGGTGAVVTVKLFISTRSLFCYFGVGVYICTDTYTLNNIGSLEETLQYNHHATPGGPWGEGFFLKNLYCLECIWALHQPEWQRIPYTYSYAIL